MVKEYYSDLITNLFIDVINYYAAKKYNMAVSQADLMKFAIKFRSYLTNRLNVDFKKQSINIFTSANQARIKDKGLDNALNDSEIDSDYLPKNLNVIINQDGVIVVRTFLTEKNSFEDFAMLSPFSDDEFVLVLLKNRKEQLQESDLPELLVDEIIKQEKIYEHHRFC